MDSYLILDVHLVEFIDAADTVVCEHQSTSFDTELSSFRVLQDTSGETSSTGSLTTGVDGSWEEGTNVFKELTLSSGGVTNHTDVDIASELDAFGGVFLDTTEQLEQDTLLDIVMAIH